MDYKKIPDMLAELNYSNYWLDCGVLTKNILIEQIKQLELGNDKNTEHYRYRTLKSHLKLQASFDNNHLRGILRLLEEDNDKSMAGSATILLLKMQVLTDKQFNLVADFLRTFGDWTTKYIDKAKKERIQNQSS